MMKNIFRQVLGVSKPWYIESIEFDKDNNKLDIFLDFYKGSTFTDKDNLEKQYKARLSTKNMATFKLFST